MSDLRKLHDLEADREFVKLQLQLTQIIAEIQEEFQNVRRELERLGLREDFGNE
jgi:hypothetical protein